MWIKEWLDAVQPGALLLSGGNDIGEFPDRNAIEGYLLTWAKEKSAPVLGICRGMQMLGHWSGCGLKRINGHVGTRHQLVGTLPGYVNSYHEFSLASCPSGFEVLATAEDGEIEAIRHMTLPWEGWMWHPEREDPFSKRDLQRLVEVFS
jgi:putative glutamine amidotransferase